MRKMFKPTKSIATTCQVYAGYCNAPAMHLLCICNAPAMHMQCTCNAHAMHMQC